MLAGVRVQIAAMVIAVIIPALTSADTYIPATRTTILSSVGEQPRRRCTSALYDLPRLERSSEELQAELVARNERLHTDELTFGADDVRIVPALLELADLYRSYQKYSVARSLYERAAVLLERAYGNDLRMVPALIGMALGYGFSSDREDLAKSRSALERVVRLYETTPAARPTDAAEAEIALGDWNLTRDHREEAMTCYARAWALLVQAAEGSTDLAERRLGEPCVIDYPVWDILRYPAYAEGDEMFVVVEFSLRADGSQSGRPKIVESDATFYTRRDARNAASFAIFRPKIVDGRGVAATYRVRRTYERP